MAAAPDVLHPPPLPPPPCFWEGSGIDPGAGEDWMSEGESSSERQGNARVFGTHLKFLLALFY